MPKAIFSTCCGCVELRVGCFIIAYLSLVGGGISTVNTFMHIFNVGAKHTTDAHLDNVEYIHAATPEVGPMAYITLVSNIFSLILCFVLLVGLHEDKPGLVKFYLICNVVYMIVGFVMMLVTLFKGFIMVVFIIYLLILSLSIYLLLVIASYYCKMLEGSDKVPVYQNSLRVDEP